MQAAMHHPSFPRATRALAMFAVAATACALQPLQAAEAPWKPTRPVELIAMNAPGGGSDRILRIMMTVLQQQKALPVAVNVVNKPGGGGAVAYNYLNTHPGDGHYLLVANKSLLTNNIIGKGPSYTEFTPVVGLFNEYISVTVKPDSPIANGRDLIERVKKDPMSLSFGVATSLGNANHQGAVVAFKEAGVDVRRMKNAIFPSGGAASTAMMGGHVDVVPITASFAASMLKNKQVRVLAVAAPQRLPGVLADVPTWREQGYDAVVSNWRAFVGPKGMTPAQIAYWEEVMQKFTDSAEWKKELEDNLWSANFEKSATLRKHLDRDNAQQRALLVELGLAKADAR